MALKQRRDGKMWKDIVNFDFIVIISGLLYLMLFVTCEPVCYSRTSQDERNGQIKMVDCDGSDNICLRFASKEDVNMGEILNSPCAYPEDDPVIHETYAQAITCSTNKLPIVPKGSFDCAFKTDISKGKVCTLTCDDGFYPASSSQAVCEAGTSDQGGVWSKGSFECRAITCSTTNLPTVTNGSFDCAPKSDVPKGNACKLTCKDGFYPPYSNHTVCEAGTIDGGGEWSKGRSFECHAITCQTTDLPTVKAGFFNCSGNSVGNKCNLTCDDGYYPSSSNETVCLENIDNKANWTAGNFQCTAITCHKTDLPTVNAGFFNCSGNSVGNKCNLTCDQGYYPSSSNETVCEENIDNNANWTAGNFQCTAITCQKTHLPTVRSGFFNCSGNSVGNKCNLTCDDGYYPSSSKETVCEENTDNNANWTAGNFQCTAITCQKVDLPTVKAGFFNCSGNSVGNKCNLTCDDGYYPSSSNETVCEENIDNKANWTAGNFQCSAITCQKIDLPTVNAGFFNCSGYSVGDRCNLTCDSGSYPCPSKETVCEAYDGHNANWTAGKFKCTAITCLTTNLPTVTDGSFDCSPNTDELQCEACTLTCSDGFYPPSSNQAVCEAGQVGGVWSSGTFECRRFECNDWNLWKWSTYKLTRTYQNWTESRRLCESSSSHLVTIENKEENDFVYKLALNCSKSPWIGLNDINAEGTWEWSDGTVSTYRNWREGEPDDGDEGDCVYIEGGSGEWHDDSCTYDPGRFAVCEGST